MSERVGVSFGQLEQGRGLAQHPADRDRRAFDPGGGEHRLDRRADLVPGGLDPQGARAAEQGHCGGLVGERRGIGLEHASNDGELLGLAEAGQQAIPECARPGFVGTMEHI